MENNIAATSLAESSSAVDISPSGSNAGWRRSPRGRSREKKFPSSQMGASSHAGSSSATGGGLAHFRSQSYRSSPIFQKLQNLREVDEDEVAKQGNLALVRIKEVKAKVLHRQKERFQTTMRLLQQQLRAELPPPESMADYENNPIIRKALRGRFRIEKEESESSESPESGEQIDWSLLENPTTEDEVKRRLFTEVQRSTQDVLVLHKCSLQTTIPEKRPDRLPLATVEEQLRLTAAGPQLQITDRKHSASISGSTPRGTGGMLPVLQISERTDCSDQRASGDRPALTARNGSCASLVPHPPGMGSRRASGNFTPPPQAFNHGGPISISSAINPTMHPLTSRRASTMSNVTHNSVGGHSSATVGGGHSSTGTNAFLTQNHDDLDENAGTQIIKNETNQSEAQALIAKRMPADFDQVKNQDKHAQTYLRGKFKPEEHKREKVAEGEMPDPKELIRFMDSLKHRTNEFNKDNVKEIDRVRKAQYAFHNNKRVALNEMLESPRMMAAPCEKVFQACRQRISADAKRKDQNERLHVFFDELELVRRVLHTSNLCNSDIEREQAEAFLDSVEDKIKEKDGKQNIDDYKSLILEHYALETWFQDNIVTILCLVVAMFGESAEQFKLYIHEELRRYDCHDYASMFKDLEARSGRGGLTTTQDVRFKITVYGSRNFVFPPSSGKERPPCFVRIKTGEGEDLKTKPVKLQKPTWGQTFTIHLHDENSKVSLQVYTGAEVMGMGSLPKVDSSYSVDSEKMKWIPVPGALAPNAALRVGITVLPRIIFK